MGDPAATRLAIRCKCAAVGSRRSLRPPRSSAGANRPVWGPLWLCMPGVVARGPACCITPPRPLLQRVRSSGVTDGSLPAPLDLTCFSERREGPTVSWAPPTLLSRAVSARRVLAGSGRKSPAHPVARSGRLTSTRAFFAKESPTNPVGCAPQLWRVSHASWSGLRQCTSVLSKFFLACVSHVPLLRPKQAVLTVSKCNHEKMARHRSETRSGHQHATWPHAK